MPQMAPLWWLTMYGLILFVYLGVNWLNYYMGSKDVFLKGSKDSGEVKEKIYWKW